MGGVVWLFIVFTIPNLFFTIVNFWQMTNAKNLTIFSIKFSNLWTFWLGLAFMLSPFLIVANYLFAYAFWYGYNVVFPGQAWRVQEVIWLSSILIMFFTGWLYLGELPTKNTVIALFFLLGAVAAIVWK